MRDLIALVHRVQEEGYFESVIAGIEDWQVFLEKRDQPPFDKCWIDAFNAVQRFSYQSPNDEAAISVLREFAFKETFRVTEDPEIAAYVSDDIGLIAEALAKSHVTPWCEKMLASYHAGHIPC